MWGAASFPFRCARCSCTPVWVRGSRSSRRCPYRVAVPPEGGGAPPALGGRRAAPAAPQLRWVRGGGGGWGGRPPARSRACVGGGGRGGARWMCAGVAWLKPKGFAKPWVHGLPLGMGWWSMGIMAAIIKSQGWGQ